MTYCVFECVYTGQVVPSSFQEVARAIAVPKAEAGSDERLRRLNRLASTCSFWIWTHLLNFFSLFLAVVCFTESVREVRGLENVPPHIYCNNKTNIYDLHACPASTGTSQARIGHLGMPSALRSVCVCSWKSMGGPALETVAVA